MKHISDYMKNALKSDGVSKMMFLMRKTIDAQKQKEQTENTINP